MPAYKIIIYLCGLHALSFAVFHAMFWKMFRWKEELPKLSRVNRAIFQILNTRIIYVFLFIGLTCFIFPDELHNNDLGKAFLIAGSLFWLGRLIEQFIFLNINRRSVHILSFIFALGIVLFAIPLFI